MRGHTFCCFLFSLIFRQKLQLRVINTDLFIYFFSSFWPIIPLPVTVTARPISRGRIRQQSVTSSHCSMQYYCGSVKVKVHFSLPGTPALSSRMARRGETHFVGPRCAGPTEEPIKLTTNWYQVVERKHLTSLCVYQSTWKVTLRNENYCKVAVHVFKKCFL